MRGTHSVEVRAGTIRRTMIRRCTRLWSDRNVKPIIKTRHENRWETTKLGWRHLDETKTEKFVTQDKHSARSNRKWLEPTWLRTHRRVLQWCQTKSSRELCHLSLCHLPSNRPPSQGFSVTPVTPSDQHNCHTIFLKNEAATVVPCPLNVVYRRRTSTVDAESLAW